MSHDVTKALDIIYGTCASISRMNTWKCELIIHNKTFHNGLTCVADEPARFLEKTTPWHKENDLETNLSGEKVHLSRVVTSQRHSVTSSAYSNSFSQPNFHAVSSSVKGVLVVTNRFGRASSGRLEKTIKTRGEKRQKKFV